MLSAMQFKSYTSNIGIDLEQLVEDPAQLRFFIGMYRLLAKSLNNSITSTVATSYLLNKAGLSINLNRISSSRL